MADPKKISSPEKQSWRSRLADSIVHGLMRFYIKNRFGTKLYGEENLKDIGSDGRNTVMIANHITMLDAVAIVAMLPKKLKPAFAIYSGTYDTYMSKWYLRPFLKRIDLFPIDVKNPMSLKTLSDIASTGRLVFIFPTGRLSRTNGTMKVYTGAAVVADAAKAVLRPFYLGGFEFSPYGRRYLKFFPKNWFPKFSVTAGAKQELEIPEGLKGKTRRAALHQQLERIMHEIPLLGVRPEHTYLDALHKSARDFGMGRPILDYYESQEATTHSSMSYGDVLAGAYALGEVLKKYTAEYGINDNGEMDGTVGLMIPNGRASVATLALMAYGRVPAMLNPRESIEKLLSVSETARLKTIITSRQLVEAAGLEDKMEQLRTNVPEGHEPRKIIYLEDLKQEVGTMTKARAWLRARGLIERPQEQERMSGSNPAIIYFTSGSTGDPKAVVLSHENILVNITQLRSVDSFHPEDSMFNAMPQFHAFGGTGGFMLPLLHGIRSLQYPNPLDGKTIPQAVYDYFATTLIGTDTFLNLYLKGSDDDKNFLSIRNVILGGERVKEETIKLCAEVMGITVNQGYGMTEAGPVLAMNVKCANRIGSVGRMLPGVKAKLEPIPGYANGHKLTVQGRNIMLGYLLHDAPGKLKPLPNGELDTGDIVKIDDKGYVSIVGRAKRLVIIGGENVELDEIERTAASAAPGFEYATIARPDAKKGEATVLFTTNPGLTRTMIVDFMQAAAAGQSSPENGAVKKKRSVNLLGIPEDADIIYLPELPKLGIGKADYPALSRLFAERAAGGQTAEVPTAEQPLQAQAPGAAP